MIEMAKKEAGTTEVKQQNPEAEEEKSHDKKELIERTKEGKDATEEKAKEKTEEKAKEKKED